MDIKSSIFLLFILLLSCQPADESLQQYEQKDYVYYEKVDSKKSKPNPYTTDNQIYTSEKHFGYDCYFTKNGGRYQFIYPGSKACASPDQLTAMNSTGVDKISSIHFIVDPRFDASIYYQNKEEILRPETTLTVSFGVGDELISAKNLTKIVENKENVWMHNYWYSHLAFLEMLPNPFIKAPYKRGNKWVYNKQVELRESFYEFNLMKGKYNVECLYQITGEELVKTPFGPLRCHIVEAIGKSKEHYTTLRALFNEDYGFVELEFELNSMTTFHLSLTTFEQSDASLSSRD